MEALSLNEISTILETETQNLPEKLKIQLAFYKYDNNMYLLANKGKPIKKEHFKTFNFSNLEIIENYSKKGLDLIDLTIIDAFKSGVHSFEEIGKMVNKCARTIKNRYQKIKMLDIFKKRGKSFYALMNYDEIYSRTEHYHINILDKKEWFNFFDDFDLRELENFGYSVYIITDKDVKNLREIKGINIRKIDDIYHLEGKTPRKKREYNPLLYCDYAYLRINGMLKKKSEKILSRKRIREKNKNEINEEKANVEIWYEYFNSEIEERNYILKNTESIKNNYFLTQAGMDWIEKFYPEIHIPPPYISEKPDNPYFFDGLVGYNSDGKKYEYFKFVKDKIVMINEQEYEKLNKEFLRKNSGVIFNQDDFFEKW